MATEITHIIDPDNAVGTDYTSLAAWEAAQQRNLVTADEIATAECRCTGGTADTSVTVDGWTTDATRYIKILTDPTDGYRHNGTFQTGNKYRLVATINGYNLNMVEDYCQITGIQVSPTYSGTGFAQGFGFSTSTASSDHRVDKCLVKGGTGANGSGIFFNNARGLFTNCLIYDMAASGGFGVYTNSTDITFANFTVQNCHSGMRGASAGTLFKNCGLADCTTGFAGTSTQTTCSTTTPTFVNAAGDDFHLDSGDTTWKDAGTDLSGTFTDDIDGETRSGTWDIGMDEVVAAAGRTTKNLHPWTHGVNRGMGIGMPGGGIGS